MKIVVHVDSENFVYIVSYTYKQMYIHTSVHMDIINMNIITTMYINMYITGQACIYIYKILTLRRKSKDLLQPKWLLPPQSSCSYSGSISTHAFFGFFFSFYFILVRGIIVIVPSHIPPNLISVTNDASTCFKIFHPFTHDFIIL